MTNETLYNGIVLPETWPPQDVIEDSPDPLSIPYLNNPPEPVPIDLGRQLFVDDFLIESTSLTRVFGQPEIHPAESGTDSRNRGGDGFWQLPHGCTL